MERCLASVQPPFLLASVGHKRDFSIGAESRHSDGGGGILVTDFLTSSQVSCIVRSTNARGNK